MLLVSNSGHRVNHSGLMHKLQDMQTLITYTLIFMGIISLPLTKRACFLTIQRKKGIYHYFPRLGADTESVDRERGGENIDKGV